MPAQITFPQRILIINIFGIGDVLFTTPLIRNLKTAYPQVHIGYLCNRRTAPVLERLDEVDRVFIYDRDALKETAKRSRFAALKEIRRLTREIRHERFEASIDVSLNDFTGWLTWISGIPRRIGFQFRKRGMFLNEKIFLQGYERKHVVDYYLDLLKHMGVPVTDTNLLLGIDDEDHQWAKLFLEAHGGNKGGKRPIGIVPGGGASWGKEAVYKRWSTEKYAKLADNLIDKFSVPIILMGDQSEKDLCREVAGHMAHAPVLACGETTIAQFAALARQCALMIVNDGGPLHIAVAAGVRTASIFGPVDDQVYGPYPKANHIVIKNDLVCRPCYRRFRKASCEHISCLSQLTVEEVLDKISGPLSVAL